MRKAKGAVEVVQGGYGQMSDLLMGNGQRLFRLGVILTEEVATATKDVLRLMDDLRWNCQESTSKLTQDVV